MRKLGLSPEKWLTKLPENTLSRDSELFQLMNDSTASNTPGSHQEQPIVSSMIRNTTVNAVKRQSNHYRLSNLAPLGRNSVIEESEQHYYAAAEEEAQYLYDAVYTYLIKQSSLSSNPSGDFRTAEQKKKDDDKTNAILSELQVNPNGSYLPLRVYHLFVYGSHEKRLIAKLSQASLNAEKTKQRCLQAMGTCRYYQDVALIHSFIEGN